MTRVPPSVRLKAEIDSTLQSGESVSGASEPPMVGFVGRLARYMLQVAIEAEATAFLGREHYRRGAQQRAGWRNGYEAKYVQTEAGLLELAILQTFTGRKGLDRLSAWSTCWLRASASQICSAVSRASSLGESLLWRVEFAMRSRERPSAPRRAVPSDRGGGGTFYAA